MTPVTLYGKDLKFLTVDEYRISRALTKYDITANNRCKFCALKDDHETCSIAPCEWVDGPNGSGVYVLDETRQAKNDIEDTSRELSQDAKKALTGGSSDYYKVKVEKPTSEGVEPYTAECNDIIEALELNFAEGNILKALWRRANARKGNGKSGFEDGKYDAEKMVFFSKRELAKHTIK